MCLYPLGFLSRLPSSFMANVVIAVGSLEYGSHLTPHRGRVSLDEVSTREVMLRGLTANGIEGCKIGEKLASILNGIVSVGGLEPTTLCLNRS